jgi:hypothetical protein
VRRGIHPRVYRSVRRIVALSEILTIHDIWCYGVPVAAVGS